jgi:hypothetical protein
MSRLRCALSQIGCRECERNPDCAMYSERYVLVRGLRRLDDNLSDTRTIIKAILERK